MHRNLLGSIGKRLFVPICLILIMQATAIHLLSVPERDLPVPGLRSLPAEFGDWKAVDEQSLDQGVTDYLKPDEYILRNYANRVTGSSVNMFVAFFKSLQSNYGPHSPAVCMPGAGWLVRSSKVAPIQAPGRPEGIQVNQYVLEKGEQRILMLYWYQNNRKVWADELDGKMRLLPDLIRYRRSDLSLVRLVTPLVSTTSQDQLESCSQFAKAIFPSLVERFASVQ